MRSLGTVMQPQLNIARPSSTEVKESGRGNPVVLRRPREVRECSEYAHVRTLELSSRNDRVLNYSTLCLSIELALPTITQFIFHSPELSTSAYHFF